MNFFKLFLISLLMIFVFSISSVFSATCTPASAILCATVDDQAEFYLNGTLIDSFVYCGAADACVVKCVSLTPAELLLLQPTGNILAARLLNLQASQMWMSWSLDITCSEGGHSYVSSASIADIQALHDSSACPADPLANDIAGKHWYDTSYITTTVSPWMTPVVVTDKKWGKRIFDPGTGSLLPALGYDSNSYAGSNDCQQIFFRQTFDMPIDPTPVPPNFAITKSASQIHQIAGPQQDTFTLSICNTGGGTKGNVVTITDNWITSDNWQFQGLRFGGNNVWGQFTDPIFGSISAVGSGPPTTFTFDNGFPANSCYDLSFVLQTYNPTTQCLTWTNNATLNYLATPGIVGSLTLDDSCPTPLGTSTSSPTKTVTPTFTITPTATMPPMLIQLTKTISENVVMLGDTFTYCIHYNNASGSIASFRIWDTIPLVCDFVGTDTAGQTIVASGAYSIIYWDLVNISNGASGTICFYVKAARLPYLKFDEYLAWIKDTSYVYAQARNDINYFQEKI